MPEIVGNENFSTYRTPLWYRLYHETTTPPSLSAHTVFKQNTRIQDLRLHGYVRKYIILRQKRTCQHLSLHEYDRKYVILRQKRTLQLLRLHEYDRKYVMLRQKRMFQHLTFGRI